MLLKRLNSEVLSDIMKLSIPKVVKLQESRSVQLFYADKNRFGACNVCMQLGLSRLR